MNFFFEIILTANFLHDPFSNASLTSPHAPLEEKTEHASLVNIVLQFPNSFNTFDTSVEIFIQIQTKPNFVKLSFKVRCGWIFVAIYLRLLLYAKTNFKILEFYDKEFKSNPHFYMYYLLVPSDVFSSLVQAVTSQAENCEHLNEVFIE